MKSCQVRIISAIVSLTRPPKSSRCVYASGSANQGTPLTRQTCHTCMTQVWSYLDPNTTCQSRRCDLGLKRCQKPCASFTHRGGRVPLERDRRARHPPRVLRHDLVFKCHFSKAPRTQLSLHAGSRLGPAEDAKVSRRK